MEKPENLILDEQILDENREEGSNGVMIKIKELSGRLNTAMFLAVLALSTIQLDCKKVEKIPIGEVEEHQKTEFGEKIVDISDCCGKEFGGKVYQVARLKNGKDVFIDPVTLEILKTKSGEKIIYSYSDEMYYNGLYEMYSDRRDEEIGGKMYKFVTLENGKTVFIDPVTLEILKTKSGEKIIFICHCDQELGGKKYSGVTLENGKSVFIDSVTLEIEIPKTKSGEKIVNTYIGDKELGGKKYRKAELEDGRFVLIDTMTLEILKTKSGEKIVDIHDCNNYHDCDDYNKLGKKEYKFVKLENGKDVFIDPVTLEIKK